MGKCWVREGSAHTWSTTISSSKNDSKSLRTSIHGNYATDDHYRTTESDISEIIKYYSEKNSTYKLSIDSFDIKYKLGRGAYAEVYLVEMKSTKQFYAMKWIK